MKQLLFSLIVITAASCGPPTPTAQPAPPPLKLNWDVSQNNRIERVGWPAKITDHIWLIDGPGTVRLKCRGGIEHDIAFRHALVERDGERIKTIRLELADRTLETVYADAMKLAADWRITDTRALREFKRTFGNRVLSATTQPYSLDEFYSVHGGNEIGAKWSIGIHRNFGQMSGNPYFAVFTLNVDPG